LHKKILLVVKAKIEESGMDWSLDMSFFFDKDFATIIGTVYT
jgi:hypothetical protein